MFCTSKFFSTGRTYTIYIPNYPNTDSNAQVQRKRSLEQHLLNIVLSNRVRVARQK